MLTLAMMLGILVLSTLIPAAFLRLSARLVRAAWPSYRRAVACVVVAGVTGLLFLPLLAKLPASTPGQLIASAAVGWIVGLGVTWTVHAQILRISFLRSMLVSVPYLALSVPLGAAEVYLLKTYCLEAFVIPTNSMAPTVIGYHHEVPCPICQGTTIIPGRPPDDDDRRFHFLDQMPKNGICTKCRKISEFQEWPKELKGPQRLLCNKLLNPLRGDLVVFLSPRDPTQKHVQRLVGLPGEKLEIKQGSLWINEVKWEVAPELTGLVYHSEPALAPDGKNEPRSWQLGPDECFVLGDFTTNAADSRDYGPLPCANLVGVMTVIYWPPSGWRILR